LPAGSTEPVTHVGRAEEVENTRIMAPDGTLLPAGQVGEIVVRSQWFTGYWNNPEANEESFVDGWFRTGDEGAMDAEGRIILVGRVKEVINSGGAKISPYEVEEVLRQHPQVTDAAVFGLRNADVGETVAAAVVGTVTERELRRFASERLPFYKVPTRILLVEAIPRTASGKVQRNRLADLLNLT
jgi:acyl-CoA synthetase (AMP-forming)/AMP-acid ligase II